MINLCPACGNPDLKELPFYNGDPLNSPSHEICACCGFQFGFTDLDLHITYEQWRQQWIAGGMVWDKGRSKPPQGWDPHQQLLNIDVRT